MRYFVTGTTGFIGEHVARQLIEARHEVITPVRTPPKARELADLGVMVVKGDVTDKESMRASMQGVDGVYHIAGWYKIGAKDTHPGVLINVQGTRNVLELMRELLNIAEGITGIPVPLLHPSRAMALFMDVAGKVVPLPESYTGEGLRVAAATYLGSNAKAVRALGYSVRPLEEGLRETLAYEIRQAGMQPVKQR